MKVEKAIKNKILNRKNSIELVVSEKCQNNCKYCYRVKKHSASPIDYINVERADILLSNFLGVFDLDVTYYQSLNIELFGGDALLYYNKFKLILDLCMNKYKFNKMIVPTNTRLLTELNSCDIEELLEVSPNLLFSLSVDGNPADKQRPLSKFGRMLSYDEKVNYDKLIYLAHKYKFGFHPMFSFDNYDIWYDSFKFFVDKGVYPYLLEVRHSLTPEEALKCVSQLRKIRIFVDSMNDRKITRQLNTISASQVPRGLGCSAHTTFCIMPNGDVPFCHRVVDPPWVALNLLTKEWDVSKHITLTSAHHHSNHPICMICPIRDVCTGQCAGASYEYWGDPWIPIASICDYMQLKFYVFINTFDDWANFMSKCDMKQLESNVFKVFGESKVKELLND